MQAALFHGDLVESRRILYTPSAFAKDALLHIQEIGELQAQREHVSRRDGLSSYLFFSVLSGAGELEYGGQCYPMQAGDVAFIDCRRPYAHRTSSDLWRLRWVHFDGEGLRAIYAKYLDRGGRPCFRPRGGGAMQSIWERLYETAISDDHIRDMRLAEGLFGLLSCLMAETVRPGEGEQGRKKRDLTPVRVYLDGHYTERISLGALADRFYINKFYLTRLFREQFGTSINQYLLHRRITQAKELLRFTDKTVEAVGYECGIGAVAYFSRVFREVEGMSPGEYRRMWLV